LQNWYLAELWKRYSRIDDEHSHRDSKQDHGHLEGITTMNDAQRREILNQIDEITKQVWEHHHEETREQIDQLYKELYQRIKELRPDAGEG